MYLGQICKLSYNKLIIFGQNTFNVSENYILKPFLSFFETFENLANRHLNLKTNRAANRNGEVMCKANRRYL